MMYMMKALFRVTFDRQAMQTMQTIVPRIRRDYNENLGQEYIEAIYTVKLQW